MAERIADILARKDRVFSFEVFPPKTPKGLRTLYRTVEELAKQFSRLSRDSFTAGYLDIIGVEIFTTSKVRKTLDRLITEASPSLIRLIQGGSSLPLRAPIKIGKK